MTHRYAPLVSITLAALCATACGKADPAPITSATMTVPPMQQLVVNPGDKVQVVCRNYIDTFVGPPDFVQDGFQRAPNLGTGYGCRAEVVEHAPLAPDASAIADASSSDSAPADSSSPDAGTPPDANILTDASIADRAISADTLIADAMSTPDATVAADAMTDAVALPAPIVPDISSCPIPSGNVAPTSQMFLNLGNGCVAYSLSFFTQGQPAPVRTNGLATAYVWGDGALNLNWPGGRPTVAVEKVAMNGWAVTRLNMPVSGNLPQGQTSLSSTQTPDSGSGSWWIPRSCAVAAMSTIGKNELRCSWYNPATQACGSGACFIEVSFSGFSPSFNTNMSTFVGCPGEFCP